MTLLSHRLPMAALCASLCASVAACAGPDPIRYSGIEASPQMMLNHGEDADRIPYRYAAVADWRDYDRVLLEPVAIYRGADHQFADMSEEDKDELTRTMQKEFAKKLQHRFVLVRGPGPHTLRIRLTLTGAVTNTAVLSTFSHLDLAGNLYNGVQAVRGGEGAVAGSVMYSVEIFDAATNRLLNAYVAKQYPGAMNIGSSFGSLAAARTGIEKGADTLAAQLR